MARPTRCRRVCAEPVCSGFVPRGGAGEDEVVLTVDEYEVIRLVDYEKRTHEQCAGYTVFAGVTGGGGAGETACGPWKQNCVKKENTL